MIVACLNYRRGVGGGGPSILGLEDMEHVDVKQSNPRFTKSDQTSHAFRCPMIKLSFLHNIKLLIFGSRCAVFEEH
jgi:hypothetical protein